MAGELIVRPATEADVKAACRLYNRYVKESTATFQIHTLTEEEFEAKLLRPLPHGAWVVTERGKKRPLGYSVLGPFIDRCASARWSAEVAVYLAADACGRGIGRLLLNAADDHAKEHRIRTVVAVICSENTGSCRFFGRSGYRHCGSIDAVAEKFGRTLGVEYYQKIMPLAGLDVDGIASDL